MLEEMKDAGLGREIVEAVANSADAVEKIARDVEWLGSQQRQQAEQIMALTTLVDQQQDRLEAQERMLARLGDGLLSAQERTGTMLLEVVKEMDGWRARQSPRR